MHEHSLAYLTACSLNVVHPARCGSHEAPPIPGARGARRGHAGSTPLAPPPRRAVLASWWRAENPALPRWPLSLRSSAPLPASRAPRTAGGKRSGPRRVRVREVRPPRPHAAPRPSSLRQGRFCALGEVEGRRFLPPARPLRPRVLCASDVASGSGLSTASIGPATRPVPSASALIHGSRCRSPCSPCWPRVRGSRPGT